jgi:NADPH-dependent glutamate synthase beta subunit-like oxidoreductase
MTSGIQWDERQRAGARYGAGGTGEVQRATCCVIGCGPAGAMLGLMLAREGVDGLV